MPRRGRQLIRRIALCLVALVAACAPAAPPARAVYLGSHVWEGPEVGGISGLELSEDGSTFLAISDRSVIWQGTLQRRAGSVAGVTARASPLRGREGRRISGDSEGLALAPDGSLLVSFEGRPRVWRYDTPESPARPTARFPDLGDLHPNKGLEALAMDGDGAVIAIAEGADAAGLHGVWRFSGGAWTLLTRLPGTDRFQPVGADVGPDGALYLLERRFSGLGFQSRVRRIDLETGADRTLLVSGVGLHDNLEGLSVWRDSAGALRLTMVSDDNFNALQRTEFVEYRLDAGPGRS